MTEEIKKKIDEEADEHGFRVPYDGSNNFYDTSAVHSFAAGAAHGYSLAEKEIERLKGLVEQAFYYQQGHPRDGYLWQQFKSENNLIDTPISQTLAHREQIEKYIYNELIKFHKGDQSTNKTLYNIMQKLNPGE